MNKDITISIPENVLQRASILAEQKQRTTEDILREWLEDTVNEIRIEDLTDEEVLQLTKLKFTEDEQDQFSDLLGKNREGTLTSDEKDNLDRLTRKYEIGLLRKSKALRIAVERGLILPLAE